MSKTACPDIPGVFLIAPASTYSHPFIYNYPRHMLLAHVLASRGDIRDAATMNRDKWTSIMDTGVYEGAEVPLETYLGLIEQIRPTYVILPDDPKAPWKESYVKSCEAAKKIYEVCSQTKYIYCPQGRSVEEVLEATAHALCCFDPDNVVIGLGLARKHFEAMIGDSFSEAGRYIWAQHITRMPRADRFAYHILGARWPSYAMRYNRLLPRLLGVDTFKAVTCASCGTVFDKCDPIDGHPGMHAIKDHMQLPEHVSITPEWTLRVMKGVWNLERFIL